MEREAMEQINKNLGDLRAEYYKNQKFISAGEFKIPPIFELKGYDDEPTTIPDPPAATTTDNQQPQPQNPAPETRLEIPAVEPPDPQPESTESPETSTPETETEPTQPAPTKAPRMLSRLSNELNGSNWTTPDFTVRPLRSRRRFITSQIHVWNHEGEDDASPENTEPVPDDEPQTDPGGPETPAQANHSTQEAPGQENP